MPSHRRLSFVRLALAVCLALVLVPSSVASAAQQAGVQTHPFWGQSDAEVDSQLDAVAASGAKITRADLGWQSLQQNDATTYEPWFVAKVDRFVAQANARGIKPFFTVLGTPCWASTAPDTLKQACAGAWWERGVQTYAPASAAAYGNAMAYLAARYRGKVSGWELWNEPNHPDFFKTADQAARYVELVKAAYPLIKNADPAAVVVAGAVSLADTAFVTRLFSLGISGSFDAFSMHPYSHNRSPLDLGPDVLTSFIRGVPAVHDVMVRYGNTKPMWLSESGFSTSTVRGDAWSSGVSDADQALFLEQQFTQVRKWSYVAVNIWYQLKDYTSNTVDLWGNTGLLRYDGRAKPAYAAFQRAAASLAAAAPAPAPAPTKKKRR